MGIWLELHCDNAGKQSAYGETSPGGLHRSCYSHQGRGPVGQAFSKPQDASHVASHLLKEAKKQGWVKLDDQTWVCPYCKNKVGKEISDDDS